MSELLYAELKRKVIFGENHFFLNGKKLSEEYHYFDINQALNLLKTEGWELASAVDEDNFILTKEKERKVS